MKLYASLIWPGCAEGKYILKAKNFILAVLRWGSRDHPLPEWSPFAYVPIDPAGNGTFFFSGKHGIPPGISHIWACCYTADFSTCETISAAIPDAYLAPGMHAEQMNRFSIMSDLHLTSKPWRVRQALKAAQSDMIFLVGDSTNDGLSEQFEQIVTCIEDTVPQKLLFPVIGNHDVLRTSQSGSTDGCKHYADFQKQLLARAGRRGYGIDYAPDGRAYAVQLDDLDVIGLQCVTEGRRFRFPEGTQVDWLEEHLASTVASWHIILCHAPLLKHNPNRNEGIPYLEQDKRIQQILDRNQRIILINGHTHVSPNVLPGNAEYDEAHQNIYLDCASVVATDTSGEGGLMAPNWKDGCITELIVTKDEVEIRMRSIASGISFPRGYYRFCAAAPRG